MQLSRHVFMDAASIESTRRAIWEGFRPSIDSWDLKSVRDVTYYLLTASVHVLPGLGRPVMPVGGYVDLVSRLPELEAYNYSNKRNAEVKALSWYRHHTHAVSKAWATANKDVQF